MIQFGFFFFFFFFSRLKSLILNTKGIRILSTSRTCKFENGNIISKAYSTLDLCNLSSHKAHYNFLCIILIFVWRDKTNSIQDFEAGVVNEMWCMVHKSEQKVFDQILSCITYASWNVDRKMVIYIFYTFI